MKRVFQADDGTVFTSEAECKVHEAQLKKCRAKEKLASLCGSMCREVNVDDSVANEMAEYMIEYITSFGPALAPFIPKSKGPRI
jgi:hypothetical protein